MELTNFQGKPCDINPYLELYKLGELSVVSDWMWNELYHQQDIGTAAIAWILEANQIFLNREEIDWNYLGFTYSVMESIEEHKFIQCPEWAVGKYRPAAIKALQYALNFFSEDPSEEQKSSLVCLSCAISKMYKSYALIEYAWGGYEERLMELDFKNNP